MKKTFFLTLVGAIVFLTSIKAQAGQRYSQQRFKTKEQAIKAGGAFHVLKSRSRKAIELRMGTHRLHAGHFLNAKLVSRSPKGQVQTFSLPTRRLGLDKKPVLEQKVKVRQLKDGWSYAVEPGKKSLTFNPSYRRQTKKTKRSPLSPNDWHDWNDGDNWTGWDQGPSDDS
jgi:hypothetical protein